MKVMFEGWIVESVVSIHTTPNTYNTSTMKATLKKQIYLLFITQRRRDAFGAYGASNTFVLMTGTNR
jgi:hypothetical protein